MGGKKVTYFPTTDGAKWEREQRTVGDLFSAERFSYIETVLILYATTIGEPD